MKSSVLSKLRPDPAAVVECLKPPFVASVLSKSKEGGINLETKLLKVGWADVKTGILLSSVHGWRPAFSSMCDRLPCSSSISSSSKILELPAMESAASLTLQIREWKILDPSFLPRAGSGHELN